MTDDFDSAVTGLIARLDAAGIASMLVGSAAASVHGRSRTTLDADLVISATAEQLRAFVRALPSESFYCDELADSLDREYIERWLDALGVREAWERLQSE